MLIVIDAVNNKYNTSPVIESIKIKSYITQSSTTLTAIRMRTMVFKISEDLQSVYIAGGLLGMSSMFRWSLPSSKVDWLYLTEDTDIEDST